jgi:hypothetical protein
MSAHVLCKVSTIVGHQIVFLVWVRSGVLDEIIERLFRLANRLSDAQRLLCVLVNRNSQFLIVVLSEPIKSKLVKTVVAVDTERDVVVALSARLLHDVKLAVHESRERPLSMHICLRNFFPIFSSVLFSRDPLLN